MGKIFYHVGMRLSNTLYVLLICLMIVFLYGYNSLISQEKKMSQPKAESAFVQGEVLVKFKSKTPKYMIQALKKSLKVKEEQHIKTIDVYQWKGDFDTLKAIQTLKKSPHVQYAEPNYIMHVDKE